MELRDDVVRGIYSDTRIVGEVYSPAEVYLIVLVIELLSLPLYPYHVSIIVLHSNMHTWYYTYTSILQCMHGWYCLAIHTAALESGICDMYYNKWYDILSSNTK